MTYSVAAI